MTTKDFVYLTLIAVTALVFYCHGFFSGVNRSRRIYDALLGGAEDQEEETSASESGSGSFRRDAAPPLSWPAQRGSEMRGNFGNN